jgi:hypothetical protein
VVVQEVAPAALQPTVEQQPTPEPKAAPVATPTYPKGCEHYAALVSKYDWDFRLMLAIAKAESGCNPAAKGDTTLTYWQKGRIYGYSLSLFQVRILPGREHCDTTDPQVNVACAYAIYKGQGLNAWTVYKTGAYRKYL